MSMSLSFLDRYQAKESLVHRLDPRTKLLATFALIVMATAMPARAWPSFLVLLALVWASIMVSGISWRYILFRSLIAAPFAAVALPSVFVRPGAPLFDLDLGPWTLTATDEGTLFFGAILFKSYLSAQMAVLLVATTPFPDLLRALRALHMPKLLVAIISFMYRYLFVVVEEALRLLRARDARSGYNLSYGRPRGGLRWQARVVGGMVGSLFLRSYERSERIYSAMLARGYRGEVLALSGLALRPADLGVASLFFSALIIAGALALFAG